MWRKGNPHTLLVRMEIGAATVENSMENHQKIKLELLYDPAIPHLGIYPKEIKSPSQKGIHTPMFTEALFTIAKTWKQVSTNG